MKLAQLERELTLDEGKRSKAYKCTAGKTTVGVGRNLDDVGLSDDEISYLLRNDITRVCADLDRELPWWRQMSEARQRAMVNFVFNVGIGTALTFKNSLALLKEGKYKEAADAMLQSRWAKQVGQRAIRVTDMIRHG